MVVDDGLHWHHARTGARRRQADHARGAETKAESTDRETRERVGASTSEPSEACAQSNSEASAAHDSKWCVTTWRCEHGVVQSSKFSAFLAEHAGCTNLLFVNVGQNKSERERFRLEARSRPGRIHTYTTGTLLFDPTTLVTNLFDLNRFVRLSGQQTVPVKEMALSFQTHREAAQVAS